MAGHSQGVKKDKFCALRREKCPCGQEYQKNGKPPASWASDTFLQGSKMRVEKHYEAHHLLCVACVTKLIAKKREIVPIVKQTQWCINMKRNMFGMPLWGLTIQHYCNLDSGIQLLDRIKGRVGAPKFENIPQHDYDHNSEGGYTSEVNTELKKLAKQINEQKQNHKAAVKSLRSELDSLSSTFRTTLRKRGRRQQGTHSAWKRAKTLDTWYEPFSMADEPEPRAFPGTGDASTMEDKIKALVKAFGKWG